MASPSFTRCVTRGITAARAHPIRLRWPGLRCSFHGLPAPAAALAGTHRVPGLDRAAPPTGPSGCAQFMHADVWRRRALAPSSTRHAVGRPVASRAIAELGMVPGGLPAHNQPPLARGWRPLTSPSRTMTARFAVEDPGALAVPATVQCQLGAAHHRLSSSRGTGAAQDKVLMENIRVLTPIPTVQPQHVHDQRSGLQRGVPVDPIPCAQFRTVADRQQRGGSTGGGSTTGCANAGSAGVQLGARRGQPLVRHHHRRLPRAPPIRPA